MKSKIIIVSLIFLFICGILFSVVCINGFRDETIDTEPIVIDESDSVIDTEPIIIIDESDSIIEEDHEYTPYQFLSGRSEKTSKQDYPNYFTPIIQEIKADGSGVGLYSVMDKWWNGNLYDSLNDGKWESVYCEYSGKEYTCEVDGESYSFDLQDELVGIGKWNWWTAGIFFDEEKDTVSICLNNAFSYFEDMVQTPHLILIEFSAEKPEEYQVWSYEVEPSNLFSTEVRKCYRLGDKVFIAGQTGDVSIDLNTKQLRYYTKESLALEDFVNEKYGEEGYQAVFFRAVYEQDGVTVYAVHVSEAFDVQPVAVVYAAVQNEKVISYMSIDLIAEYMKDGGIENIEIDFVE